MAIDGVKIIDSDSAHDVYNSIIEMYHSGESIGKIRHETDTLEANFAFSELEHEIFTTAYALAMWEIGGLTDEQLQKNRELVSKGASCLWNNIVPSAQKDRQKALERFLKKIERPNSKIKKRKNYTKITDFIFGPGEVVIIQLQGNSFRSAILVDTFQEGKTLYYAFAELVMDEIILETKKKPELDDVIWFSKARARINLGFDSIKIVSHKTLLVFKNQLEKIGSVKIKQNVRKMGTFGGSISTFEEFCANWDDGRGYMKNLHDLLEITPIKEPPSGE